MRYTVFLAALRAAGVPEPVAEHRFAPPRRWAFDFAWPDQKLAVEIEGIFYHAGQGKSRHQGGKGYEADCAKYNAAVLAGWRVLRYTPAMLRGAVDDIRHALCFRVMDDEAIIRVDEPHEYWTGNAETVRRSKK